MSQIYGPVCSRRLGFSLGVDMVPYKTCTLNCVYCQLGPTTRLTIKRQEWVRIDKITKELKNKLTGKERCDLKRCNLKVRPQIDCITFSGSGEPTLNSKIGELIKEVKSITQIPIALLTNGTLLSMQSVRRSVRFADLVIPSLDAATQSAFECVNRPYSGLKIEKIINGIKDFRQEFQGKMWLEVMLVKGLNDSISEITKLKKEIIRINPDKVQLNTVVRPPTENFAKPLGISKLQEIKAILGDRCEIIPEFRPHKQGGMRELKNIEAKIIDLLGRRPVTLGDIATSLGIHRNEVIKYLRDLEPRIKSRNYLGTKYYSLR